MEHIDERACKALADLELGRTLLSHALSFERFARSIVEQGPRCAVMSVTLWLGDGTDVMKFDDRALSSPAMPHHDAMVSSIRDYAFTAATVLRSEGRELVQRGMARWDASAAEAAGREVPITSPDPFDQQPQQYTPPQGT